MTMTMKKMTVAPGKPFVDLAVAHETACSQGAAMHALRLAVGLAALLLAGPVSAQNELRSTPQTVPLPPPIPAAQDVPFPGVIGLRIDASDTQRGIFRVVETVPVPPGQ